MNGWVLFGFFGQFVFAMRFIIQWIVSEKKKESIVPLSFWYLSICGGVILLIYAIYKKDPVFMLGAGNGSHRLCQKPYAYHKKKNLS